jgi:CBS-domain-containing membrane protein
MKKSKLRQNQMEFFASKQGIKRLCSKDAMIKPVFLYPDDNAEKIMQKLKKEHINSCIVVSKDKKFIGQVGDNDLVNLFLQQTLNEPLVQELNRGYRREFLYKKSKDMINNNKKTVKMDTPINKVIEILSKNNYEYVPVLGKHDKVVGVVTPSSLINLLKDY